MFQTAPGVTIPFPDKIQEQFQVYEGNSIYANISFEKLRPILSEFYHSLPEPLFFVLQLPLFMHEERKMGDRNTFHQEVCYLDGQTKSQIDDIIEKYGQILLEDGMSQFAVASHVNNEEIFIQKYKLTAFYSSSPRRFIPFLQRYGLTETDNLITVWNTFSQETPGECRRVSINGFDVYDVAEQLKSRACTEQK